MGKRKLTDKELEKLKRIKEENQALQDAILFETEALKPKEAKKRNEEKEKEIIQLLGNRQTSIFSQKEFQKILLKDATFRDITFSPELYDEWYRLTGLKKDEEHPNQKPEIFAFYTIKYVYGRFNIKNLMDELRSRNPFLTGQSIREHKHYQFLNDEYYNQLCGFISTLTVFAKDYNTMFEFDIKYCKQFGLTTDGDMFYSG